MKTWQETVSAAPRLVSFLKLLPVAERRVVLEIFAEQPAYARLVDELLKKHETSSTPCTLHIVKLPTAVRTADLQLISALLPLNLMRWADFERAGLCDLLERRVARRARRQARSCDRLVVAFISQQIVIGAAACVS